MTIKFNCPGYMLYHQKRNPSDRWAYNPMCTQPILINANYSTWKAALLLYQYPTYQMVQDIRKESDK